MIWRTLIHRWLKIPYTLHVHTDRRVKHPRATIVFIHGIGGSGAAWDELTSRLPHDLRLITIDLLGFGESEKPPRVIYNAKTQARSIVITLLKLRIHGRTIIVGHSLGALIAVEIAKRYPLLVRSLILCSPPFYNVDEAKKKLFPSSEKILKDLYRLATHHPAEFVKMSNIAAKFGLINQSFNLNKDNAEAYMNALETTIINQTSLRDAAHLKTSALILYGKLDPVVVLRNLRYLIDVNHRIKLKTLLAGHEMQGGIFIKATLNAILASLEK